MSQNATNTTRKGDHWQTNPDIRRTSDSNHTFPEASFELDRQYVDTIQGTRRP